MFNNACVQILQKMDKSELRALKAFIKQREPQKKQENSLFNYLYKCYPEFKEKDLDQEKIIAIFKDNTWAYPAKRLSDIGNSLTKIIEDFLVEQALKKNWSEYEFLLAFEYSRLGLPDLLDRKIESYLNAPEKLTLKEETDEEELEINKLDQEKKKDSDRGSINVWYHWNLYQMYHLRYYSRDTIKAASGETNLDLSLEQLKLADLAARLRIALEMASLKVINGKEPLLTFSNEEIETLKAKLTEKETYLYLYCHAYDLLANPDDQKFYDFKAKLLRLGKQLSRDEQGNLLTPLINYASVAIRNGQEQFYAEASFLHHYGLETGLLLQDEKITPELLLSVLNITCEAQQLTEAEALLEKWTPHLAASLKEEAIVASKGRIQFFSKKYKESAAQFSTVKRFSNHFMELVTRTSTVQSYFELEEYILLNSFCESFTKALSRSEDRFSQQHRDSYGNFVKMVQALVSEKLDPNTKPAKKRHKLELKLEKYTPIVCKKWLKEKIENL